jgi:hypothetical protein
MNLENCQIWYEKKKIKNNTLGTFLCQLCELRIDIICVMQPSLHRFPLVFMSSFSLPFLVCRHSDLTLVYIMQTYALDRAATGIRFCCFSIGKYWFLASKWSCLMLWEKSFNLSLPFHQTYGSCYRHIPFLCL